MQTKFVYNLKPVSYPFYFSHAVQATSVVLSIFKNNCSIIPGFPKLIYKIAPFSKKKIAPHNFIQ